MTSQTTQPNFTISATLLRLRWSIGLAVAAVLWVDPSSGLATAILVSLGLWGFLQPRKLLAAWKNGAGACFAAGVVWAAASWFWSFYPTGTARDLVKSAPLVMAVFALPVLLDRPERIWAALVMSATVVTIMLAVDLARIITLLGWAWTFPAARFLHPYLYTHPNVASMMAGLCALIFSARMLAGTKNGRGQVLLALGICVDLMYLLTLASRGPQVACAVALLAFPIALLPGWRARGIALVLALAIGWGLWQTAGHFNPRFRDRTMRTFNNRSTVWSHSKMLADRQPIAGYGFGKKAFVKAFYENPAQRAPKGHVIFPHAHSYWLMLYFQGGLIGAALWGAGWLLHLFRLLRNTAGAGAEADATAASFLEKIRARLLPATLLVGTTCILLYGIGDFPDSVLRASLFYFVGMAMAWKTAAQRESVA